MTESAMNLREQKRWDTSRRITQCAQRLTDQHGLDGFTMDDLAASAGVSRRTLFNYFPSKTDAVLGEIPEIPEAAVETFRAGGPHGSLVDDLTELAHLVLSAKQPERESIELGRRVLTRDPRMLAAAHQRFELISEEFAALVLEREGDGFEPFRARLLLRLVLTLFDSALEAFAQEDESRALVDVFDEHLGAARALFT
ncbi:TetR/AcrR family transcriptional regulator [Nocardioides caricicola]|uniref:TetR/AcrR family transcriptional regulator n=1 Tax=Nocardioides caricicola TaxID=634770 RepID=A0ABW0MWU2_9ACTN